MTTLHSHDAWCFPSFALVLEGDTLVPDFIDGDLLTVAPDVLPLPGDCVVALVRGQSDTQACPEYACMRLNADGDLFHCIHAGV